MFRLGRGTHFLRSVARAFAGGLIVLALLEVLLIKRNDLFAETITTAVIVNAPIYAALSYCYFNFVNLGQSSIRIRIYSEIAASGNGVSMQHIALEYNEEALMRMRLQRMIESGDIMERNGRYVVGRQRLVVIARIIFAMKKLILGKGSEFD